MSVDIEQHACTTASPDSGEGEELTSGEGEELTNEDIEELNTISQASMKFLAVRRKKYVKLIFKSDFPIQESGDKSATATSDMTGLKEASLRGLDGIITDMETMEMQISEPALHTEGVEVESAGDEEVMHRLEGLEAEILTTMQDINQVVGVSRDHTSSHDPASGDASTRSRDQASRSRDQVTTWSRDLAGGDTSTSAARSHDQAIKSHDQVRIRHTTPVSAVSLGTQFPSATDVTRTLVQEDTETSERKTTE